MDIELKNGVYFLSGRMDETSEFERLTSVTPPLKLNIGGISSINSLGVRKFLAFTLEWSPRKFEFYECTPEFIANVNVIPQMLGNPSDESQIKTFYVPFSCELCKRVENILFSREDLVLDEDDDVMVPAKTCAKCGNQLDLDVERNEYFLFLSGDK